MAKSCKLVDDSLYYPLQIYSSEAKDANRVDHDSIKFLIMQEKDSEALYAIRKVYKYATNDEIAK